MNSTFLLPMEPVGTLPAMSTLQVFGIAFHRSPQARIDNTVYLNIAGPVTAIEAMHAEIAERGSYSFRPANPSHGSRRTIRHLGLPQDANTKKSPYLRFQQRIPDMQVEHLILVDKRFDGKHIDFNHETGSAYLFDTPHLAGQVLHRLRLLVNLPVFDEWAERLLSIGQLSRLLTPLSVVGPATIYHMKLDRSAWEVQIRRRVEFGQLPWPGTNDPHPLRPIARLDFDLPPALLADDWKLLQREGTLAAMGPHGETDPFPLPEGISPKDLEATLQAVVASVDHLYPNQDLRVQYENGMTYLHFAEPPERAIRDRLRREGFFFDIQNNAHRKVGEVPRSQIEALMTPKDQINASIDTPLKRALHEHLSDAAQAVAVAEAIERHKKHGWRGDLIKEREIKHAIFELVGEEPLTEKLFDVLSEIPEGDLTDGAQ